MSYPNTTQFLKKAFHINQVLGHTNCVHVSGDTQSAVGFCNGSASVPRGFVSFEVGANGTMSECQSMADVVDGGKESPKINEECGDSLPYM